MQIDINARIRIAEDMVIDFGNHRAFGVNTESSEQMQGILVYLDATGLNKAKIKADCDAVGRVEGKDYHFIADQKPGIVAPLLLACFMVAEDVAQVCGITSAKQYEEAMEDDEAIEAMTAAAVRIFDARALDAIDVMRHQFLLSGEELRAAKYLDEYLSPCPPLTLRELACFAKLRSGYKQPRLIELLLYIIMTKDFARAERLDELIKIRLRLIQWRIFEAAKMARMMDRSGLYDEGYEITGEAEPYALGRELQDVMTRMDAEIDAFDLDARYHLEPAAPPAQAAKRAGAKKPRA